MELLPSQLQEKEILFLETKDKVIWKYTKKEEDYWNDGIVETRKKRQRSHIIVTEAPDQEPGPSTAPCEDNLNKLSVKELREKIKFTENPKKGLAKLKKCELIKVLRNAH